MSNRQLPWDDRVIRDRVAPREVAEDEKNAMTQQESEIEGQPVDDQWVPPGNADQGSRKK